MHVFTITQVRGAHTGVGAMLWVFFLSKLIQFRLYLSLASETQFEKKKNFSVQNDFQIFLFKSIVCSVVYST